MLQNIKILVNITLRAFERMRVSPFEDELVSVQEIAELYKLLFLYVCNIF